MKATVMARVVRFDAGRPSTLGSTSGGGTLDSTDADAGSSGDVRFASTRATTPAIAEHPAPMYSVRAER